MNHDHMLNDIEARFDHAQGLIKDPRVMRLMMDPIYIHGWQQGVRAYMSTGGTVSVDSLIATLAAYTLASLNQYKDDRIALDILKRAFDPDPIDDGSYS